MKDPKIKDAMVSRVFAVFLLSAVPLSNVHAQDEMELRGGPDLSPVGMKAAVRYIETHIQMPEGAAELKSYGRYYAQEHGVVEAVYVTGLGYKPGIYIVALDELPGIMDGVAM